MPPRTTHASTDSVVARDLDDWPTPGGFDCQVGRMGTPETSRGCTTPPALGEVDNAPETPPALGVLRTRQTTAIAALLMLKTQGCKIESGRFAIQYKSQLPAASRRTVHMADDWLLAPRLNDCYRMRSLSVRRIELVGSRNTRPQAGGGLVMRASKPHRERALVWKSGKRARALGSALNKSHFALLRPHSPSITGFAEEQ